MILFPQMEKNVLSFYSTFLHFFSLTTVPLGWPWPSQRLQHRHVTAGVFRGGEATGTLAQGGERAAVSLCKPQGGSGGQGGPSIPPPHRLQHQASP